MRNRTLPVVNSGVSKYDPCNRKSYDDQNRRHGRRRTLMVILGPFPFFVWWFIFFMNYGPLQKYNSLQKGILPTPPWSNKETVAPVVGNEDQNSSDVKAPALRNVGEKNKEDKEKHSQSPTPNESTANSVTNSLDGNVQKTTDRRNIPSLLIAGAQKSGTTAVASWINLHRNVCKPASVPDGKPIKEVHFFNADGKYTKGMDFYERHYSHCKEETSLLVDATPDYLRQAERVRKGYDELGGSYAKDLKVLIILREPVAREYSWFNHMVVDVRKPNPPRYAKRVLNQDGNFLTFNEYLDKSVFPVIDTSFGHYSKWLKLWMEHFDRNQILILSYDELKKDPVSLLGRLRQFLHLDGKVKDEIAVHNKRSGRVDDVPSLSCEAQNRLQKVFSQSNKDLYELLEAHPGPDFEQQPFPKFQLPSCSR